MVSWFAFILGLTISASTWATDSLVTVERPYITYHLSNLSYLEAVDSATNQARLKDRELLRDTMDYRPSLYLVGDKQMFEELIGGRFPDWGAAAAIPSKKRIVLKSPDRFSTFRPLKELVMHEYTHLALADRLGLRSAPRWLDEGLAMYVSMEWGWSNNLAMSKAAVFQQFVPLSDIELVNRFNSGKAEVAYAQSYVALKYFIDQYGINALNILLGDIARGRPLDTAMMASTGSTMTGFEREFHEYLVQRYNYASLFMDTFWFWTGLAVIVIIGGILSFRRRRAYYRKWADEERFESTDFDYGSPGKPEQPDEDDDEAWRH